MKKQFFVLLALLPVVIASSVIVVLLNEKALEIHDTESGKLYGRWSVNDGDEFAVEFIHSVNQSPVLETFKVEKKKIQSVSVRFFSFGAGIETEVEEGQTLIQDGDAMILNGLNRMFSEINYIVGTVSDHVLFINGEAVSLRDLCGKNAHITVRIR